MSLSFFREFGWEAEVVAVDPKHSEFVKDPLLLETIPPEVKIHYVQALPVKWTRKAGLGSIALRSLFFYRRKVNRLLKENQFDLIYFSTTQFPVCVLGAYWKRKHGVPYVIDMQDPWHVGSYEGIAKDQKPSKFWFASRLNAWLEPKAMKHVDGLISVSEKYLQELGKKYNRCKSIPKRTITFGWFQKDLQVAAANKKNAPSVLPEGTGKFKVAYVGRGGADMKEALDILFHCFSRLKDENSGYKKIHFYFIGTSYAGAGKGIATILPVAKQYGMESMVTEITDRIPFYQALNTLADANALFIAGSNDARYTASKIYPYVMVNKPLLAIFHPQSSAVDILRSLKTGTVISFEHTDREQMEKTRNFFNHILAGPQKFCEPDPQVFEKYSARSMTGRQCELFNEVVS